MSFSELYNEFRDELSNEKTKYQGSIWHYTSAYGLKGILKNENIWFSDRRFLNDPTECNYLYKLIGKNKLLFNNYNPNFFELLKKIINNFSYFGCYFGGNIFLEQLVCFIASFSKDKDNLPLWNYYTKSQNSVGYAIKLSTKKILKQLKKNGLDYIYGEVIYKEQKQIALIKRLLDAYNKTFNVKYGTEICQIDKNYFWELAYLLEFYNIFFKPEAYENEKEYRFVIFQDGNGELKNKKFRIWNDIFIPYIELPLYKDNITEIKVSPAINQDLLAQGINFFKNETIYTKAKITCSNIEKRY